MSASGTGAAAPHPQGLGHTGPAVKLEVDPQPSPPPNSGSSQPQLPQQPVDVTWDASTAKLGHPTLYEVPQSELDFRSQETVWLRRWNLDNDPDHVSCRLALDILYYCQGPRNQMKSLWDTGHFDGCPRVYSDLHWCMKARALARKDKEKARQLLEEKAPAWRPQLTQHVWKFRTGPPPEFICRAWATFALAAYNHCYATDQQ